MNATLAQLASDLAASRITSRDLVERCLAAIQQPAGEGSRTFLKVNAAASRAAADFHDSQRRHGWSAPFAGIPISIKDLFDVSGEVTTAGSRLLVDAAPASADALCVARLRAAGFILIGRTNMTEFAFSGLGLNPHYGTPANPADRLLQRIPGGSSSGAGVSVATEMAYAGLGTDTGGSCRIPAALCGVVGFKPTAHRIPLQGALPLAPSLDSIGPLANSVECCAGIDAILADEPYLPLPAVELRGLRFAVPQSYVLDDLDTAVAESFGRVLQQLSAQGAVIVEIGLRELLELPELNHKGGIAPAEAYAIHREWIATRRAVYDPRVCTRILRGKAQDAADYIQLLRARQDFGQRVNAVIGDHAALLLPTVPVVAPAMDALADDAAYLRTNALLLRNPSIINFIDGCAISIPCQRRGELPVGLMLAATRGEDRRLLGVAAAVAKLIAD